MFWKELNYRNISQSHGQKLWQRNWARSDPFFCQDPSPYTVISDTFSLSLTDNSPSASLNLNSFAAFRIETSTICGYFWNLDAVPGSGPWKNWTLKKLDSERPGTWKTWILKNRINMGLKSMSDFRELCLIKTMHNVICCLKFHRYLT